MTLHDLAASLGDAAQERAVARDVEAELAAHLELAAEALQGEGHAPEAARRLARERFGDLDRVRRECLSVRLGGIHVMKKLLVVVNLVLLAALAAAAGFAYLGHTRAVLAMEQAQLALEQARAEAARAEALAVDVSRLQAAVAPALEAVVVEVGDVIEILDQHRIVDLSEQALVQPDGKVLLHDVGWIDVVGLTREQVEQRLAEAYAPYYQDLTVNAIVHKARPEARPSGALDAHPGDPAQAESLGQIVSGGTPIVVGDTIEILDRNGRFDLGGPRRVDADGRVLLPRLGWTPVAGLERDQLAEQLTVAYQPYFGQLPVDVLLHRAGSAAGSVAPSASVVVEDVLGGATTVIEVGDSVEVLDRQRELDFGGRAKVAPDGKVLLPHVGWIQAAGKQRDEFARSVTDLLAPLFVSSPTVDVILYERGREVRTLSSQESGSF
jgi:protein involved in polysaccharide export with SLBB domain